MPAWFEEPFLDPSAGPRETAAGAASDPDAAPRGQQHKQIWILTLPPLGVSTYSNSRSGIVFIKSANDWPGTALRAP